jgi:FKBP-type peptidyl-prolyl cis-trans isomerase
MRSIILFFGILVGLSSCTISTVNQQEESNANEIDSYIKSKNLTMQKSPEGLFYAIDKKDSTGKQAFPTDLIKFHYVMSLLDGKKLDSTSRDKNQIKAMVWGGSSNIYNLPISLMKEGEKGVFILPASLAFGGNSYADIPAYSVIRLDIEVVAIRTETEQIQDFQTTYKITNPEVTPSGLVFKKLVVNPTGATISAGQTVKVNYTGRFGYGVFQTDATKNVIFDSSFGSGTLTFVPGTGNLIPGFEEGILKMRVGEKAALVLPSKIAYGTNGNSTIPPNSPLYFEVEVVGVL